MYKLTSDPFQLTSLKPHADEEGVHIKVVSFHEATEKMFRQRAAKYYAAW